MHGAVRTGCILLLALAVVQGGCAGTSKQYERRGMAGAVMVLSGTAMTMTGRSLILQNKDTAGVTTASIGGALQLTGVVLIVHALDGLIGPPPEYFPVDRYWSDRALPEPAGNENVTLPLFPLPPATHDEHAR